MKVSSVQPEHPTDDQLIAHLYGVGPEDRHLDGCARCQARLSGMKERQLEASAAREVSNSRLAAQRRVVYDKLTGERPRGYRAGLRRWASVSAAALVLSGGVLFYESQKPNAAEKMLSDAQLAQDVSRMSDNPEAQPTAPLRALFEE